MHAPIYIPCVDGGVTFPHPSQALTEPDGLLAYGGDLSIKRLTLAYHWGIFPWFNPGEPILWWSPNPRMVIYPENFHISRSLKRFIKKNQYSHYWNRNFMRVIKHCAAPRDSQTGTWISSEMQNAYCDMFKSGNAFCLEIEYNGQLAGGIYGIKSTNVYFGESMFSTQTNGSKIALMLLCQKMQANNIKLLDCQIYSSHLESLGAQLITRELLIKTIQTPL